MKERLYLFVLLIFLNLTLSAQDKADMILHNGKIITVDSNDNIYQAIAVKGEKILAVGNDNEIIPLADVNCKLIDLGGKTATPGLIDSHYHMMYYGAQFWNGYLNIRYPVVKCKADLLQVIKDYVKNLQPGEWVSGNQGFALQQNETLDKTDLDPITPDNPVYLRHSSGQYSVVNTMALNLAGITDTTKNPPSSLILRDGSGHATGVLSHYGAENLVGKYASGYGDRTDEQKFKDIELGQGLCFQAGYTSVQDVILGSLNDIQLYKQYADEGKLKMRVYTMLLIDTEAEADFYSHMAMPANSGRFTFGGWKLAMDGGPGARTTLMYNKNLFASQISYPYHTQDEMNRIVKKLHDTGYQVAVHVGGDEGIDMTITSFELAMQQNPRPDPRHRIEHGIFPAASAIQRMKDANIILSTQPQWIAWYGDGYKEATDEETMNAMLPLKTMLDMGIHIAFGCDVPASIYQEPKYAFMGAVFRRTGSGALYTQNEKLTIQEALRIHTMGSAYAGFAENTTGSLEPGKFADIVVWSHDLYNMAPQDWNNLEAVITIVGGEVVWDAASPMSIKENTKSNSPKEFKLCQNYPNPFNPVTVISYQLAADSHVLLKVYDILGREVATLIDKYMKAGKHTLNFNAGSLSRGMYFYRLTSGNQNEVRKMVLLR